MLWGCEQMKIKVIHADFCDTEIESPVRRNPHPCPSLLRQQHPYEDTRDERIESYRAAFLLVYGPIEKREPKRIALEKRPIFTCGEGGY